MQEETLLVGARDCEVSGSYGRKGTNSEKEQKARFAVREWQERVGVHVRTATASPTGIFYFTLG